MKVNVNAVNFTIDKKLVDYIDQEFKIHDPIYNKIIMLNS